MLHWKTNEEMGNGYQYNEQEHQELSYNSLLTVDNHEENTMRTNYLVRDIWNDKQLAELKDYINSIMESRSE